MKNQLKRTVIALLAVDDLDQVQALRRHQHADQRKPIAISYDTICAAERIAPRNAYFEFDAQPAMMMP